MQLGRILRYTGLAILLAVLAVGPFFRGLFFWTELLAAIAAVSFGFTLWLIGRRLDGLASGIPGGAAGIALLALLGAYLLQFAWAVYPRGNLDWVLRVSAAWFAFVMVRAESGPGLRRWLGWTYVLSAVGVAVVGLMQYTGYMVFSQEAADILAAFAGKRMLTSFQYFNTGAAYLLAAVLVALGLGLTNKNPWGLALTGCLTTLLLLGFFFTVSRGAIVILPFALVCLFAGLASENRWPAILLLFTSSVATLAVAKGTGANAHIGNYISAFRWIGAGAITGATGGLAIAYYLRLRGRWQLGLVALAIVLGALVFTRPNPTGGILPSQATRLLDISLKTQTAVLRLVYTEDALRIFADHPMGLGGWGWDRTYKQYQKFNYTAQETHNHYAQTAVEAGVLGLLALVVGLARGLWAAFKVRSNDPLVWPLAAGVLVIAGHSLIDFNLSFGLVWLAIWILLAASNDPAPNLTADRWALGSGLVAGTVTIALTLVLFVGHRYTDRAVAYASAGQHEIAATLASQAVRFDPWDSTSLQLTGRLPALERAARLDPNMASVRWQYALALERVGDVSSALEQARAALDNQPMVSTHYTKVASLAGTLMVDALHNGDTATARELAGELAELGSRLQKAKATGDFLQSLWNLPKLEMAPGFRLRYGQALFLTGNEPEAELHLLEAAKFGLLGSEAHVWLYAMYERRGDGKAMAELADLPWVRFRATNPVYKAISRWQN